MRLRITLVALALGVSFGSGTSKPVPVTPIPCPADPQLAMLLAASDVVLVGKMEVPKQRLLEEGKKQSPVYLDLPIEVSGLLKGENVGSAAVRFYPRDSAYRPSNESVLRLADERAILFLTQVEDGPIGLYFAGYSPDALRPATDQAVKAVRQELSRQAKVINSWRLDISLPRFREAVPAMISLMDDRRPLQTHAISLLNRSKDAFEGKRHYAPKQVVDGLAAVLNQITGRSFSSISSGGSDRQRAAAVAGWRVYGADLACRASR